MIKQAFSEEVLLCHALTSVSCSIQLVIETTQYCHLNTGRSEWSHDHVIGEFVNYFDL